MPIIEDGFPTTIDFTGAGITFYERSITPPGYDGGGENDVTTMRNLTLRTRVPKKLKTVTNISLTVLYDDAIYAAASVFAEINVNQLVTVTFPSGGTLAVWGWANTFDPSEISEGEPPTADMNIIVSNRNGTGVETAPVYTPPGP
jgi:hypothetical protein